jgi:hypothetical protein
VRISGAGRIADFRERLRWLMVRDPDAEDYTEHLEGGVLEYRFEPKKGIPFPALTQASGDFPELRVEAQWEHDGVKGRAVIENGRVMQEEKADPDAPGVDVEVGDNGLLVLGLVAKKEDQTWLGYAATADRHAFFRFEGGKFEIIEPDEALEDMAFAFAGEWLWYDEEDAALERTRYAGYGFPVRGANLRAEKLALLRRKDGRYSTLAPDAAGVRDALMAEWQKTA